MNNKSFCSAITARQFKWNQRIASVLGWYWTIKKFRDTLSNARHWTLCPSYNQASLNNSDPCAGCLWKFFWYYHHHSLSPHQETLSNNISSIIHYTTTRIIICLCVCSQLIYVCVECIFITYHSSHKWVQSSLFGVSWSFLRTCLVFWSLATIFFV